MVNRLRFRILGCGLTLTLALVVASVSVSAHEARAVVADPDPLSRSLFFISGDPSNPVPHGAPPEEEGYSLSLNASQTSAPSREHVFEHGLCVGWCAASADEFGAPYVGDDFEVEHQDAYEGSLHVAWSYEPNAPAWPCCGPVGYIIASLTVGGEDYGTATHTMDDLAGDAMMALVFSHDHECGENQTHVHNGSGCFEPGNETSIPENQTLEDVHASDFQLTIVVWPTHDAVRDAFGGRLTVKFDTSGVPALHVRQVPPPPAEPEPAPEPVNGSAEADVPVSATYSDTDGDGEIGIDELHFAPGVSPVLVMAALGLIGVGLRRLRR